MPNTLTLAAEHHSSRTRKIYILVACQYFAQGLPLGLIFQAFPALLREQGVPLEHLAFLPALGLPWMLKFLWCTPVDRYWATYLGRRRSWILPMQITLIITIGSLAFVSLGSTSIWLIMALLFVASLASATQDIATDGLAAEQLKSNKLLRANSLAIGGMMSGMLIGGPLVLIFIDYLGPASAFTVVAFLLVLTGLPALRWKEPINTAPEREKPSLLRALKRRNFIPLWCLTATYAMAATAESALAKLFLIDQGWSLQQVGWIGTINNIALIILGCGGATWIAKKYGSKSSIFSGLLVSALAAIFWQFIVFELLPLSMLTAGIASALAATGLGLTAVAVFAYLMRFAQIDQQAGTDVTLLKSGNSLGEMVASSTAISLAAAIGYTAGFMLSLAMALTALVIAYFAIKYTQYFSSNDIKKS